MGGNVIGEVISAVVKAKLTLVLGPTGFGRYSQALAATEVADGMAAFGLNQVGPVLGAEYPDKQGTFLGVVLAMRSAVTLIVLGIAMFVAPLLIQSTPSYLLRLALLALLFSPLAGTANIPFFIKQENWRIAWMPGALALLGSVLLILVIWLSPTVWFALAIVVIVRAANAGLITTLSRLRYRYRFGFDRSIAAKVARVGPKAAWLDTVVILYSKASYFVLDGLGPVALGIYSIADQIAAAILRLTGAVSATSLAMFAELSAADDLPGVRAFYLRTLRRIGLTLFVVGLVIFILVPPAIRHWFTPYVDSIPVLYILYVGICFMATNQITSSCLNGLGHFGWVATVATINLFVYAVGAWLWVATYEAAGAALATTFMEGCNSCMQLSLLFYTLRRRAVRPGGGL